MRISGWLGRAREKDLLSVGMVLGFSSICVNASYLYDLSWWYVWGIPPSVLLGAAALPMLALGRVEPLRQRRSEGWARFAIRHRRLLLWLHGFYVSAVILGFLYMWLRSGITPAHWWRLYYGRM